LATVWLGLPADFLIGTDGRVLALKYGTDAYDQWSVDELHAIRCSCSEAFSIRFGAEPRSPL
jgi:hypothetical protein